MRETRTYTQAERAAIIAAIRAGLEQGKRVAVSARELGITAGIFYRWVREQAKETGLKAAAAPAPRSTCGARSVPTEAQKRKIVEAIRRRVAAGARVADAARAEGVSQWTYYGWLRWSVKKSAAPRAEAVAETAMTLRPVALVPAAPSALAVAPSPPIVPPGDGGLVLVAPGGYRLEGLGVEAAAQLLRALR